MPDAQDVSGATFELDWQSPGGTQTIDSVVVPSGSVLLVDYSPSAIAATNSTLYTVQSATGTTITGAILANGSNPYQLLPGEQPFKVTLSSTVRFTGNPTFTLTVGQPPPSGSVSIPTSQTVNGVEIITPLNDGTGSILFTGPTLTVPECVKVVQSAAANTTVTLYADGSGYDGFAVESAAFDTTGLSCTAPLGLDTK